MLWPIKWNVRAAYFIPSLATCVTDRWIIDTIQSRFDFVNVAFAVIKIMVSVSQYDACGMFIVIEDVIVLSTVCVGRVGDSIP